MERIGAIRGATTAKGNTREEILAATRELITELVRRNKLDPEDVISVFFTVTPDLNAAFPAEAARQLGYTGWPMLDSVAVAVPGALPRCIRVLFHVSLGDSGREVCHVYLREAKRLRPDWAGAD
ncbi:MAG: chorismate mutase [Firmicutes bacterium]|nr:chorismate mutase [Bacillota bacterium]